MSNTRQFIVMLGLDDKKQPRAAKFDLTNAEVVRKAAVLMSLSTAIPKTDEQRALMVKIVEGKLFASGRGLVPLVKKPLYDVLIAKLDLEPVPKNETANQPTQPLVKQPLPQAWLDLKVGGKVVAPDPRDPANDGWWPALITAVSGDKVTVRWIDAPKVKAHTFPRGAVAILPPADRK